MTYEVHNSECIAFMRTLPDNHVDAIVTDPPYELGFMGKGWDKSGIANNVEMWAEALRILKAGGHLLAFSGSRTYHRMTCAIEDAGFEVRDQIMWVYGNGFPKSHNLKGDWQGWGTALKPAHEPICVARKPLQGTVANNVLTWGTGAINVDGCRVDASAGRPLIEIKAQSSSHVFGNGLNGSRCAGVTTQGRWPANLIHDGSDEVMGLFPSPHGAGCARVGSDNPRATSGKEWQGPKYQDTGKMHRFGDSGSAARFFYCAKASKQDRDEGCEGLEEKNRREDLGNKWTTVDYRDGHNSKVMARNHHPTVKPTELMRYLCRLVTPPNGIVFDPFTGSGSTGKAAILEGFRFLGCDMTPEYVDIARARIEHAINTKPITLFK